MYVSIHRIRIHAIVDSIRRAFSCPLNKRNQTAILNRIIMPDGSYRHSVVYLILEDEWEEVKECLEKRVP